MRARRRLGVLLDLEEEIVPQVRDALREVALLKAAPEVATVIRDGQPVEVAAGAVQFGETVLVRAGGRIPVDGEVTFGKRSGLRGRHHR